MLCDPPLEGADRNRRLSMEKKRDKSRLLYLIPLLGTIFCMGYILAASEDVVYSDYIRLVNSYLPDVWDPKTVFVADILTRIPVNFLERIINVTFFGYSTTFEMLLGAACHGVAAILLTTYCRERKLGLGWYLFMMVFFFRVLLSLQALGPGVGAADGGEGKGCKDRGRDGCQSTG